MRKSQTSTRKPEIFYTLFLLGTGLLLPALVFGMPRLPYLGDGRNNRQ